LGLPFEDLYSTVLERGFQFGASMSLFLLAKYVLCLFVPALGDSIFRSTLWTNVAARICVHPVSDTDKVAECTVHE
jgi:hypothetical protein